MQNVGILLVMMSGTLVVSTAIGGGIGFIVWATLWCMAYAVIAMES